MKVYDDMNDSASLFMSTHSLKFVLASKTMPKSNSSLHPNFGGDELPVPLFLMCRETHGALFQCQKRVTGDDEV